MSQYNECCPLATGSIGCTNTLLALQQATTPALVKKRLAAEDGLTAE